MGTRRRVVLLGATGSVGRQALEVIASAPDRFEPIAIGAGSDAEGLAGLASRYGIARTGLGEEAAVELAALDDADIVLNAIVGAAGLRASATALAAGKTLALANKESLVAGGKVCKRAAAAGGGTFVPVDSEHNAIAQCLRGVSSSDVARIVITASGGPFRTRADLSGVTPEEALAHPTWSMGPKITVDSATLMNKGLEVIEAHFLFDLPYEQIDVVVHSQSLIHGIVELRDGATLMHAAPADMKIPIACALDWPDVSHVDRPHLDLTEVGPLEFEPVDHARFPLVNVARDAATKGGTYPAALNAANEVAVGAFLERRISFAAIASVVEDVLEQHESLPGETLEEVLEADSAARAGAARLLAREDVPA